MEEVNTESMTFDTYDELVQYLNNTEEFDKFIIKSVEKFIDDKDIKSIEIDLVCLELNKVLRILYERDMIDSVLDTLLQRYLRNEEYEKCITIKDLVDNLNKVK